MNWDKIKEKYPKAIELLDDWVYENHPDIAFKNIFYFLEYFFDEQGIRINVESGLSVEPIFRCIIFGSITMSETYRLDWCKTRTLAEEKSI